MDRVDESTMVNNENDNGGEEAQSTFKETMISAIQVNKQLQVIKGDHSEGTQTASNCIAVVNGANACRQGPGEA
jgi:hypothetical protein